MHNLEPIEQRCLNYLKQASNPLVPLSTLVNHLKQHEDTALVDKAELLAFLRKHELFKFYDPILPEQPPEVAHELAATGIPTEPRVILDTRVPTHAQILSMMYDQVESLYNALSRALEEARNLNQHEKARKIVDALERADKLKQKLAGAAKESLNN